MKRLLVDHVRRNCPDVEVIVGLEARGFLFSLLIAAELGVACVPIRKKGKLPGECVRHEYQLEYGTVSNIFVFNVFFLKRKFLILGHLRDPKGKHCYRTESVNC